MANLSIQQLTAVDFIGRSNRSLVLEAVAGAGKTTTLLEMVRATEGTVAFCAFNKSISEEIKTKIQPMNLGDRVKVGTLHSFGYGAVRRAFSVQKVTGYKLHDIAKQEFNGEYEPLREFVIQAADKAKNCGIGAVCPIDDKNAWLNMIDHYDLIDSLPGEFTIDTGIDAAQYLLNCSNNITNIIDYSDQIYFPILKKLNIWKYNYILLDEAQDTNIARRMLVKMMLKPSGRLIAVGDTHQAIYGFTGADSDALDNIRKEFDAESLPLTTTYRCPKNVVKVAQRWVSHIESHESSPDGVVDNVNLADIHKHVTQKDAIICRNTKPLIELAYSLIRQGIACKVEGRSIGEGLIRLATKWKTVKTVNQLQDKLDSWSEHEIKKHKAKGNDNRCQIIEDQVATLHVFMEQCDPDDTINALTKKIDSLFGDTQYMKFDVLTLSTIHKAKGREWDRVFALGMDTYSPSKWARQDWQMQQEDNLCYVQVTRAKNHLTLVKVPEKVK